MKKQVDIIFENENFSVFDKPAGWLTIPARFKEDKRPCLSAKGLFTVHRLDEEVSGLVIFAKSAAAHRIANLWFEEHTIQKFYEAYTEGEMEKSKKNPTRYNWHMKLLRGKKRAYESECGKDCETIATWTGFIPFKKKEYLHWNLEAKTGRSHQLRVALASHGFPILGDELYGSKNSFNEKAIALRAMELRFTDCPQALDLGLPLQLKAKSIAEIFEI